ncbi:hypothetical protein RclHR1_17360006 [Rhizophagus clarus]|nr:hypothetical protein RclHR1_17360006 [Rhizophagus clarus]
MAIKEGLEDEKLPSLDETQTQFSQLARDHIEFAEMCDLDDTEIPDYLKQNARVLIDLIKKPWITAPILIIQWTEPFPRNDHGQTKDALIRCITNHGGTDLYGSGTIFTFHKCSTFTDCVCSLPDWSWHDRGNIIQDVGHAYRLNKISRRKADLEDYKAVFNI